MRIAWIGPMMNASGGASGVSFQLLRELALRDLDIDCYLPGKDSSVPEVLRREPRLRFICLQPSWEWNRWYSRNNFLAFVTGQLANLRTENRLAWLLLKQHLAEPYDLVYQFSHIEMSSLRKYRKQLPPIVIHPSVHAGGELRFHRRESIISRKTESLVFRIGVRCMLLFRTGIQRWHIKIPERVLTLSGNFAQDLVRDYRVPPEKICQVPNPIDLAKFRPRTTTRRTNKIIILFVSRIAVRKGVQMVVDLSHRLDDLSEMIEIRVVGYKSLWSDYMGLLESLNPRTATYLGEFSGAGRDMPDLYQSADILVQPSQYEPFGLTVAEALASGIPVVASDKVGAAESVSSVCCRTFPSSDINAFEQAVRRLIHDISDETVNHVISITARSEAERLYSSKVVGDKLMECFSGLSKPSKKTSDNHMFPAQSV